MAGCTACSCIRDGLHRIYPDPQCRAPSHRWDVTREKEHIMLTGSQKAIAAFIISTIGGIITVLVAALPDNNQVQLIGGITAGIVTVLATTLGVYSTENKPQAPPQV